MTRSDRQQDASPDRCVTGPHAGWDEPGKRYLFFRCENCGTESTDPALKRGCWTCDGRIHWR